MSDDLDRIAELCKGEVYLEINPHRGVYQTPGEYVKDTYPEDMDQAEKYGVNDESNLIILQFYPRTSIGFHLVIDSILGRALDRAVDLLVKGD